MNDEVIRLVLADDQVLFVESLKRVLEMVDPRIVVAGIAHDGNEAIAIVEREKPDVVLLDVRMPGMDGVEAVRIIHSRFESIRVIMLTTFDNDEYVLEALARGAVGYLLKDIEPEKLAHSIRAVFSGSVLMNEAVASRFITKVASGTPSSMEEKRDRYPEWYEQLSSREREVLRYILKGWDNQEIADVMCIAEQTLRNHISVIYSKIGEHNRIKIIENYRHLL
jgi:DNA-binding NarL/FixJ family response regulator